MVIPLQIKEFIAGYISGTSYFIILNNSKINVK